MLLVLFEVELVNCLLVDDGLTCLLPLKFLLILLVVEIAKKNKKLTEEEMMLLKLDEDDKMRKDRKNQIWVMM